MQDMTPKRKGRSGSTAAEKPRRGAKSAARKVEKHRATEHTLQETMHRIARQVEVVEQLGHEEELFTGDVDGLARKITERAAGAIGCERVNVWLFDDSGTSLRCIDSFEATPGTHSAGEVLCEDEYRNEFEILKKARYVAADDALTDPRTAGYVETYLRPLRIASMLDAVIQVSGKHLGLICFEHVDRPHHWEQDEIFFAGQLADKLAMALISRVRRQAEEGSRANERKLRDLVEIVSDYIWEIDENGIYTYVTAHTTSVIGYSPAEMIGKSPFDFMSPDESSRVQAAFAPLLAARRSFSQLENTVRHKDGRQIVFETSAVPIFGERGEFKGYRGIDRDVTKRKYAESALRDSQQLIEGILNAIPVRVFWKDLDLVYLGCNAAFAQDAGHADPKDLIGKNDYQMTWRDQAELYRADDRKVIESGKAKLLIEEPQTTPDGKTITLLTSKLPLRRMTGEIYGVLGIYMDISDRKRAEDALRASEERFRAVSESAQDAIIMIDDEGRIAYWNNAAERILGYTVDEATGKCAHDWLAPERFRDKATAGMKEFAATGRGEVVGKTLELAAIRKDGVEIPVELSIASMRLDQKWHAVATLRDITERKRVEEEIRLMARRDFLTGLANRAEFVDKLDQEISRAQRGSAAFAVIYLDLDHFKDINDTLGHPTGDLLLKQVGQRLQAIVRETDTVARFGGDEFAIIEADVREPSEAGIVAEKLLKALGEPFAIGGNQIRSGASIGISVYGPDGPDAETLLTHADVALYRAKAEGRGTYRFFTPAMDAEVRARVALVTELREALDKRQFLLMYQPQTDIETGRVITLEALVRWNHPGRGLVSPLDFIDAAEKSSLILPLGHWVLYEACRQTKEWIDAGLAPPRISVNVSAVQFKTPLALEKEIESILSETGLPPELLELEFTESVLMEASADHRDALLRLRKAGLRIAMDDFGTGYSSLSYLSEFPVDLIKIAQTFMLDLRVKSGNAAIVKAAIGLANDLGLEVVIEGVETEEQLKMVRSWGGRIVQGFYFSKPVTAAEVATMLRRQA